MHQRTTRAHMPKKSTIARYWCEGVPTPDAMSEDWPMAEMSRWYAAGMAQGVTDLGEPSCMGCGVWSERWDEPPTIDKRWQLAALQRCHLLAHEFGGREELSNLVLLCERCHVHMPDDSRESALAWLARPRSFLDMWGAKS